MCSRERKMTHVARKAPPPPVCGFMIWCGEHFEQNCSSRAIGAGDWLHCLPPCTRCALFADTQLCVFIGEDADRQWLCYVTRGNWLHSTCCTCIAAARSFFLCSAYMGWRPRRRRGIVELYFLICETLFALFTIAKNCWRNGVFSFTFHPRRIFWLLPTCGNSITAKSMPRVHCRIASRRSQQAIWTLIALWVNNVVIT